MCLWWEGKKLSKSRQKMKKQSVMALGSSGENIGISYWKTQIALLFWICQDQINLKYEDSAGSHVLGLYHTLQGDISNTKSFTLAVNAGRDNTALIQIMNWSSWVICPEILSRHSTLFPVKIFCTVELQDKGRKYQLLSWIKIISKLLLAAFLVVILG